MKNFRSIIILFVVVLMELIALGMIIPLSPYLSRSFGADDLQVGLLMSIYSILQCLVSPIWGKLSDRWGRRPILIISLLFTSLSYLWFAVAPNLTHLFLARALAGVFGVTVSTSFALMSDWTEPKNRSKNMGLIGASFGLGFIIGPALGGALGILKWDPGISLVAFGACLVCLLGFIIAIFMIKEDRPNKKKNTDSAFINSKKPALSFKPSSFIDVYSSSVTQFISKLSKAFQIKSLNKLLFLFFILSLSLTLVEAPLFLLMKDKFQWSSSMSSFGFSYIGFILALTQGFLVRYFIPKQGEQNIILWSFIILCFGFVGMCIPEIRYVAVAVTIMSLGYALCYTCLTGCISMVASADRQGGVLGIHQSLSSAARIIGPALGGWMYRDVSWSAPFIVASILAFISFIFAFIFKKWIPNEGKVLSSKGAQRLPEDPSQFTKEEMEYVQIELDQIQSILNKNIPCQFYNLHDISLSEDSILKQKILKKCQKRDENQILEMSLSSDHPVILICGDGQKSSFLALKLNKQYSNIYYLKDGLLG